MSPGAKNAITALLSERSIVICCGSGGVGKTTTAAAIALAGAMSGMRACVVTIDPARRLADALEDTNLTDTAHRIDGPWRGELFAVMLDAKATFDHLVEQNARDAEQANRILTNRLYRNLVSALSGTQEYMATEKLYELHTSGRYDLVVVDTPPTPHALDFLEAPRRLASFLDNRIFKVLLAPGKAYVRAVNVAAQLFLKTVGKIAGSDIVDDTIAFFQAFEGMEQGFRDRAEAVEELLSLQTTAFVLVTSPRRDAIEEAAFFAGRLDELHHAFDALVVNRMHPRFGPPPGLDITDDDRAHPWCELVGNLKDLFAVASREEDLVAALIDRVAPAPVIRVPLLDGDVHDIDGLESIVGHLIA